MTPERVARLVAWWVRFYTRGLPAAIGRRRVDEIAADLHDHIAYERANGAAELRIAFGLLSRMVRGAIADASWRRQVRPVKDTRGDSMKSLVAIVAIAVLVVAMGVAAIVYGEADDAPGLQLLGGLFVIGAIGLGLRTVLRSR
jgi:hypothetical protein